MPKTRRWPRWLVISAIVLLVVLGIVVAALVYVSALIYVTYLQLMG